MHSPVHDRRVRSWSKSQSNAGQFVARDNIAVAVASPGGVAPPFGLASPVQSRPSPPAQKKDRSANGAGTDGDY